MPNPTHSSDQQPAQLKRSLGLWLITFYGLGNILGAGIYVLVGKVVGSAGMFAPLSFLIASLVAAFTAFSYAELSARMPVSAGESVYIQKALGQQWLSTTIGILIALAGMVSAATVSHGFVGYLDLFIVLPDALVITLLIVTLGALAAWGITQSVTVAALLTLIEIFGLLLVIAVSGESLTSIPEKLPELLPGADLAIWQGIMIGAFLAFFAYIGFEDMVNVAEEVKSPRRNLPLAIILALLISSLLYGLVALVAVLQVPVGQLASSDAPLADIYHIATGKEPLIISQIGLFAVVNGALIQIIMAARLFYGMSHQGWLPALLARVSPLTHTPLIATLLVTLIVLSLALWLPLITLAKLTSYIVLIVFSMMNLALLIIKRKDPHPEGVWIIPMWVPILGLISSVGLTAIELISMI